MGNLDSLRDWGHAKDYVRMQWMMLQQDKPTDYVIATGMQYSVRDFIVMAASKIGLEIEFKGNGENEEGCVKNIPDQLETNLSVGDIIIKVDKRYYRPTEVETLLGDPSKAAKDLGWTPEITIDEMVEEMMKNDMQKAKEIVALNEIK